MFDLASPESTALFLVPILMSLTELLKERIGIDGDAVEVMAFVIGASAGALWFASYNDVLVEPLPILGLLLSALAFGLVPSGLYKLAFRKE